MKKLFERLGELIRQPRDSHLNQLNHLIGQELELLNPDGSSLWRYDYGSKPKSFFHPLCTPKGFCLSLFEPSDHVWHRGLWFTFKFVNGENFWEESAPFGTQQTPVPPTVVHHGDGSFQWISQLEWQRPNGAGRVLHETRQITYRPLGDDSYALDWEVSLGGERERLNFYDADLGQQSVSMMRGGGDVLLDRTPFTTWGGYGGLTMRGNRNWLQTRLLFPDGSTDERPKGVPAQWCDFSGTFDGGKAWSGGIALFDHPENVRHPSPWYGATGRGHYLNAALLFHEPLTLQAGSVLHLRYRALIHDDLWETARLQSAYNIYAEPK